MNAGKVEKSRPVPGIWRRTYRNFKHLPVVSEELVVDPGGLYPDIAHIEKFGEKMNFPGGVNKPKLVQAV